MSYRADNSKHSRAVYVAAVSTVPAQLHPFTSQPMSMWMPMSMLMPTLNASVRLYRMRDP